MTPGSLRPRCRTGPPLFSSHPLGQSKAHSREIDPGDLWKMLQNHISEMMSVVGGKELGSLFQSAKVCVCLVLK